MKLQLNVMQNMEYDVFYDTEFLRTCDKIKCKEHTATRNPRYQSLSYCQLCFDALNAKNDLSQKIFVSIPIRKCIPAKTIAMCREIKLTSIMPQNKWSGR